MIYQNHIQKKKKYFVVFKCLIPTHDHQIRSYRLNDNATNYFHSSTLDLVYLGVRSHKLSRNLTQNSTKLHEFSYGTAYYTISRVAEHAKFPVCKHYKIGVWLKGNSRQHL